ncbi:MAG: hypothetical protein AMXMBFR44_3160 [Candidatus Campbellbacteria bacterium]
MKNMRFPHNYRRRRFNTAGLLGIGASLFLVVLAALTPDVLTKTFLAIGRPLHLVRQNTTAAAEGAFGGFASKEELVEDNRRLTEELRKAEIKAELFDELRGNMYAGQSGTTTLRAARVLSTPPFSPYDTLVLDRGSRDGVAVGDVVSFDDTVALGTIDTVTNTTSRVQLYSSPGTEQSVRIGSHDFLVVARGEGGGAFRMLVLKEEDVGRGDSVFLSDGRLMARVEKVIPNESDAFALVYAAVPFNLFEIREVMINPTR